MNDKDINIQHLKFTQRPIPIPVDYRPLYKISIIILVLKLCCRDNASTLLKLHLFSWILKSDSNMNVMRNYIVSNYKKEIEFWNIEPALNRALQFAVADGLCEMTSTKKYKLKEKGESFYNSIIESESFTKEIGFLKFVGKNKITDSRIDEMTKQWKLQYVENK